MSRNKPHLQVTVTGGDYEGGPIEWCGKTWTEDEIRQGIPKCIYPMTKWQRFKYELNKLLNKFGLRKEKDELEI
jgi:hypothetical protein